MSCALARLAGATDAADVLDCACQLFEGILAVLRHHQEDDRSAFPAVVIAACAAANGRDWTGGEWTPPDASGLQAASDLLDSATVVEVANAVAAATLQLLVLEPRRLPDAYSARFVAWDQ
ncbi:MAG: hypothetical protein ACRDOK_16365 [Streptosporangiaceae bacterium]